MACYGEGGTVKSARVFLLVTALVGLVSVGTAQAATPSSGTLSKKVKSVKWTGSFTLSQPNPAGDCVGGESDPICDHYMLKVNLGDGARIRIDLPTPNGQTDIDFYVYSPAGSLVASSGNLIGTNEFAEFRHSGRFKGKSYEVRIVPFIVVPGTSYAAAAKVK